MKYFTSLISLIVCSLLFFFLSIGSLKAQEPKEQKPSPKLSEVSVVKDSTGSIIPYTSWSFLMKSGKFSVYYNEKADEFILFKLTQEQINIRRLPKPRESPFFRTGDLFNGINDKDIEGNKLNNSNLKGKIVLINFWFINCPPCRMEIPDLNALVDTFKENKDVVFLAIGKDKTWEIDDFIKENPFHYHILPDGGFWFKKYKITSFPTHLIIDKEGKIFFHTSGLSNYTVKWIQKSITELLATAQ